MGVEKNVSEQDPGTDFPQRSYLPSSVLQEREQVTKPSMEEYLHTPTKTSFSPFYRLRCGQHSTLLHCCTRGPDGPLD